MNTANINNIKTIFKQHISKIYPPELKDYCSYKFIDNERKEICFDVYNEDAFINFYENNKLYALIEMKTQNYHFFVDFDIFYKNESEINNIRELLLHKLNEALYTIYQQSFETIWAERQYYSEYKQINKLGIHVYVPNLIVNNLTSRIIRHVFCNYNTKLMKMMDPSVYTIYTGLYYINSIRRNGQYKLTKKYNGSYNFRLRSKLPLTVIKPKSPEYINHLINIFSYDTVNNF